MNFSSQHHSFDIALAEAYGIEKAILIHHLQHWIRINRDHNRNFKEGRYWTYQTCKYMQCTFAYMSVRSVRYHLQGLVKLGVIQTGNFNKDKLDKTLWYSFVNEKKFIGYKIKKSLPSDQNVKSCSQNVKCSDKNVTCIIGTDTKASDKKNDVHDIAVAVESEMIKYGLKGERLKLGIQYFNSNREKISKKDNPIGYAIWAVKSGVAADYFQMKDVFTKKMSTIQDSMSKNKSKAHEIFEKLKNNQKGFSVKMDEFHIGFHHSLCKQPGFIPIGWKEPEFDKLLNAALKKSYLCINNFN